MVTPRRILPALLIGICLSAASARADTVYTYTGNPFTDCLGSYQCSPSLFLSITFDTTLTGSALDNLNLADITGTLSSAKITDNVNGSVTNLNNDGLFDFVISTDGAGNITNWGIAGEFSVSNFFIDLVSCGPQATGVLWNCNNNAEAVDILGFAPVDVVPAAPQDGSFTFTGTGELGTTTPYVPGVWTSSAVGVPEPSTLLLLGTGLLGISGVLRRKRL